MKSAMAEGTGGNHRWETDKTKRVRKQKEKGRSEEQEGALDAVRQRSGKFDPLVSLSIWRRARGPRDVSSYLQ